MGDPNHHHYQKAKGLSEIPCAICIKGRSSISMYNSLAATYLSKCQTLFNYLHLEEADLRKASLHQRTGRARGKKGNQGKKKQSWAKKNAKNILLASNTHTTIPLIPLKKNILFTHYE